MKEVRIFKARDGVFDCFIDGDWILSRRNIESILMYLDAIPDNLEFYYLDMSITLPKESEINQL